MAINNALLLGLLTGLPVILVFAWLLDLRTTGNEIEASTARMTSLCAVVWTALLIVGFLKGANYDYRDVYVIDWSRVLAGENPWLPLPGSPYGVGHQILAGLFYFHPLAPKVFFILCW